MWSVSDAATDWKYPAILGHRSSVTSSSAINSGTVKFLCFGDVFTGLVPISDGDRGRVATSCKAAAPSAMISRCTCSLQSASLSLHADLLVLVLDGELEVFPVKGDAAAVDCIALRSL